MTEGFAAGWRQVGACVVLLAICAMIASSYGVIAIPLEREFGPSRMVLMLAMTVIAASTAVLSPFVGNLMDRAPMRRLMLIGVAMVATGFVALSFAATFTHVLLVYGLFMALGNVLLGPMAATVLLSRWFVKRRGTALGIAIAGIALGGFVFPPLIQALLDSFEWRVAVRLLGVLVLVIALPAVALVVDRPADRGLHPDGAGPPEQRAQAAAGGAVPSARAILSDPVFWLAVVMFAVVTSGMKGMVTNLVPMAVGQGINPARAALLISVFSGSGFISKLGFAALADRINPRVLMLTCLAGFAAGMACVAEAGSSYVLIALGVGLIGLFGGLMVPLQGLLVPRIFGQAVVGRASGLINSVTLVALLATPPAFGLIFDITGSYALVFYTFTGLAAATMLIVPYIRLHERDIATAAVAAPSPAGAGIERI